MFVNANVKVVDDDLDGSVRECDCVSVGSLELVHSRTRCLCLLPSHSPRLFLPNSFKAKQHSTSHPESSRPRKPNAALENSAYPYHGATLYSCTPV